MISANPPDAIRIETVGPPLEGRGAADRRGWRDPGARRPGDARLLEPAGGDGAAALADGWLHTGDIGVREPDGYLRITDRKKDMIVLSGGDNVSPARVEGMLMAEPEIAQAVVAGEGQPGLCALIVPAEGCDRERRRGGGQRG